MSKKTDSAIHYILSLLETGALKEGQRLGGARGIARELGISFLMAQSAISSLIKADILQSFQRKGVFVRKGWSRRPLGCNIVCSATYNTWWRDLKNIVERRMPGFRMSTAFAHGMMEIRQTISAQSNQRSYMDLSPLSQCFGAPDKYFSETLKSFSHGGRVFGVPLTFSPRVMLYNKKILAGAGIGEPDPNWNWDIFRATLLELKKIFPQKQIFNWTAGMNIWMNPVLGAGGRVIDLADSDPVKIDSAPTRKALKLWMELKEISNPERMPEPPDLVSGFISGSPVFMIASKMSVSRIQAAGFYDWGAVPMPSAEPGRGLNTQATEVLCVRKTCPADTAELFLKTMLSFEVQDFLGKTGFGYPYLKSAFESNVRKDDPSERVFLSAKENMFSDYFASYPGLHQITDASIAHMFKNNLDVDEFTGELARALRLILKTGLEEKISCADNDAD